MPPQEPHTSSAHPPPRCPYRRPLTSTTSLIICRPAHLGPSLSHPSSGIACFTCDQYRCAPPRFWGALSARLLLSCRWVSSQAPPPARGCDCHRLLADISISFSPFPTPAPTTARARHPRTSSATSPAHPVPTHPSSHEVSMFLFLSCVVRPLVSICRSRRAGGGARQFGGGGCPCSRAFPTTTG